MHKEQLTKYLNVEYFFLSYYQKLVSLEWNQSSIKGRCILEFSHCDCKTKMHAKQTVCNDMEHTVMENLSFF